MVEEEQKEVVEAVVEEEQKEVVEAVVEEEQKEVVEEVVEEEQQVLEQEQPVLEQEQITAEPERKQKGVRKELEALVNQYCTFELLVVGRKGIQSLDMEDIHFPHKAKEAGEAVALEVARVVVAKVLKAEEVEEAGAEAEVEEVDCDEEVVLLPLKTHSYSHHLIRFLSPHPGENARHPTV